MGFIKKNFKKRTQSEIMDSISKGDYTGGYDFKNWIVFNKDARGRELLGIISFILGIIILLSTGSTYNLIIQIVMGIFMLLSGIFILLWNYRTFKRLKSTISD